MDNALAGFDWKAPDYDAVWRRRATYLTNIRQNPGIVPGLREHFKENPVDFINAFGCTADPRNAERGLPTLMPFLLFPKQRELVEWIVARWRARDDGLVEKSRDMGVTWVAVAVAVWLWQFYPGTSVGFGSRKEEYVDQIGDPKSIFWKVRKFIECLPREFRPVGYSEKLHAPFMRIINPENGATIIGEAGDNIGRGNRTSIYFKDESAFYERPDLIDRALLQTSNCKIDMSTPNGMGNPFARKRHSKKVPIFTFHWRDDPRKDDDWYQRECAKADDPISIAQELDIDYNASVSDAYIDGSLVAAAQMVGPADIEPIGSWIIGVDAAHMGNDESVIHRRRGRLNLEQIRRRGIDGIQLAALVIQECNDLGGPSKIGWIVIELDGPGVSCFDQLRQSIYADVVQGVHTGARRSDQRCYNLRAWAWKRAKEYLAEPPVCLPKDLELRTQLSSMRYRFKDGELLMQDKAEYKKLFGRSPDRADAFVLTFATPDMPAPPPPPKNTYAQHLAVMQHGWLGA